MILENYFNRLFRRNICFIKNNIYEKKNIYFKITNIVQRAIIAGIRLPDAVIPIYSPFISTYNISPSRLMSLMDPLLNSAFLWRCMVSYLGIDYKKEIEKYKFQLYSTDPINDMNNSAVKKTFYKKVKRLSLTIPKNKFKSLLSRSHSVKNESLTTAATSPITNELHRGLSQLSISENQVNADKESDDNDESNVETCASNILTPKQKKRLLQLSKVAGDSVFLIEMLRIHPTTQSIFMSPLLTDDYVLAQFPSTHLIVSHHLK